jgi:Trypsin-like peptidase domain
VIELDAVPNKAQRVTLATEQPTTFKGHRVYAVGYPVADSQMKPAPLPILRRVFGQDETLGMKRFSPGTIMDWENEQLFHHDASTLRGSSGSCIVTFDDHRVVGLHFAGSYSEHNNAVPLWKFRKDLLLTGNGVLFGEE